MSRRSIILLCVSLSCTLAFSLVAFGQPGAPLPGMMPPGVFLPSEMGACCQGFKVGNWVEYVLVRRSSTQRWFLRLAAVGKSGTAWWIEMNMSDAHRGDAVCKMLIEPGEGSRDDRLRRVIIQPEGHIPLELPVKSSAGQVPAVEGGSGKGVFVGMEQLKLRKGTLDARHYRRGQGDEVRDVWVSDKVALWGLVRYRSAKVTMSLVAQGNGAVSQVTSEPIPFDPATL